MDVPAPGPGPGPRADEGVLDLRKRHPRDLPRAPWHGRGGLPGRDRRPRTLRTGRGGRTGDEAARGRRQGRDLSHCGLRGLRGVPPRLHDRVQLAPPRRARVAARRRPRRVPARRGSHLHPAARAVDVRRRRARVVRLRDGVRRPAAPPTVGAGPSAHHGARAGRARCRHARPRDGCRSDHRHRPLPAAPAHGARRRPRRPRRRRRGRGAGDRRAPHRRPGLRGEHRLLRQRRSACPRAREHLDVVAARSSARVARCRSRCPTC